MRRLRSRRGVGLVDAMICILILEMAGLIFGAVYPSSFASIRQSGDNAKATAIAQRKLEQVRSLKYESITYGIMRGASMIDVDDDTFSPYAFTAIDTVAAELGAGGTGTLAVTDESATIKRIVVTISYQGPNSMTRQVVLTTLVSDKRTKMGS